MQKAITRNRTQAADVFIQNDLETHAASFQLKMFILCGLQIPNSLSDEANMN
jgi:hypothetical protein